VSVANDRIFIQCATCKDAVLLAKYWGGGDLGPIFQVGARLKPEDNLSSDTALGERIDQVERWMQKHLRECRRAFASDLEGNAGFRIVTETES
jgi:hypothetical protein